MLIDIHTHILPEVDDGAKGYDDALGMLKMQLAQGVNHVILTPHVQNRVQKVSSSELLPRFEKFQVFVGEHLPGMKLSLGAEIKYDQTKQTDYSRYVIKGTNIILIEFSTKNEENIVDILYNLIAEGFQPIVAHVERYPYLSLEDVQTIKQDGSWLQVNTGAVLGDDGKVNKKLALTYLKMGLIDFIASDCHDSKNRKPNLKLAIEKAPKNFKMREINI